MSKRVLESLASLMIASGAQAKFDWNLESKLLMHLEQKAGESAEPVSTATAHIYPSWVSEGTCSTKCVDIRGEEEFCVATSTCEHATWRKQFDKLTTKESSLKGFSVP